MNSNRKKRKAKNRDKKNRDKKNKKKWVRPKGYSKEYEIRRSGEGVRVHLPPPFGATLLSLLAHMTIGWVRIYKQN